MMPEFLFPDAKTSSIVGKKVQKVQYTDMYHWDAIYTQTFCSRSSSQLTGILHLNPFSNIINSNPTKPVTQD